MNDQSINTIGVYNGSEWQGLVLVTLAEEKMGKDFFVCLMDT